MKKKLKKEEKNALLIICAALALAYFSYIFNKSDSFLKNGYEIERFSYGSGVRNCELYADVDGLEKIPLRLEVAGRKYTKEEAEAKASELMELIPELICGENESLGCIKEDMFLPKTIEGYPGIRLRWYPEDSSLIGADGRVNNRNIGESLETALNLSIFIGDIKKEYVLDVVIYPAELNREEAIISELNEQIKNMEYEQRFEDSLRLPEAIDGVQIRYSTKADSSPLFIILLGFVAAAVVKLNPEEKRKKEKQKREKQLMADYSDMVSKLLVYIGAGLTLRNAWFRIVELYEAGVNRGGERRACYEEMKHAADRIKQGFPEIKAYREFGRACGVRPYLRLCTILEQNLKNGDRMLKEALELEMREAFNERKNIAKRLGEEMSTKLLLPMFISMAGVMIIVAVPALMKLG